MKIRKVTPELYPKAAALLKQAFHESNVASQLIEKFHNGTESVHEWVCLHTNTVVGYIAFSTARDGRDVCGLHLGPMAVKPEFQRQGIGSELLRFALRQAVIKESTLFVSGDPRFFGKFGFAPCDTPVTPLHKKSKKGQKNSQFMRKDPATTPL